MKWSLFDRVTVYFLLSARAALNSIGENIWHLEVHVNLDSLCPEYYYYQTPFLTQESNTFLICDSPIALFKEFFHLRVFDNFRK